VILDGTQEQAVKERCANIYYRQRQRAAKFRQQLPYGLKELRDYVRDRLGKTDCPYCGFALTALNFSLDHQIPVSRGGAWEMSNLVVCCRVCNEAKGALTGKEYSELLACLAGWHPAGRSNVLGRLRGSWRAVKGG
jgi:5-methylcytosine-specific restriction endonuclease McrA